MISIEDERFIVEQAKAGSEAAFKILYEQHILTVRSVGFTMLHKQPADIDDFSQEVFLLGFTKIKQFNLACRFKSWIVSIARNVARMIWRSFTYPTKGDHFLTQDGYLDDEGLYQPYDIPTEDRFFSNLVTSNEINLGLDKLKPKDIKVLIMKYMQDMDVEEIAEETGWTYDAVKCRYLRAHGRLRENILAIRGQ